MNKQIEANDEDNQLKESVNTSDESHIGPKSESLRKDLLVLENKDLNDYSDEDYSLLLEAVKSGLAAEVFKLATDKNVINSEKTWKWIEIFIECIEAEQPLAASFCDLFKSEEFKKINDFKVVFQQCLFKGAKEEVFNLIKNVPLEDLSRWDFEFTILITSDDSNHKIGKELFSLFFQGKKASELKNWKNVLVWFDLYLNEGNQLLEMLKNESLEEIEQWEDFLKRFIKEPVFSEKALSVFLENDDFGAKDLHYWHDTIVVGLSRGQSRNNSLKLISLISNFTIDEINLYESVDILERCTWNGLAQEVVASLGKFDLEGLDKLKFLKLLQLCAERGAAKEVLMFLKSKIKSFSYAKDWSDLLKTCLINGGLSFKTKKQ